MFGRRFSGETSVSNDAISAQNGVALLGMSGHTMSGSRSGLVQNDEKANASASAEETGINVSTENLVIQAEEERVCSGSCQKILSTLKGPDSVICCQSCWAQYCHKCAGFTVTQIKNVLTVHKNNLFWACNDCSKKLVFSMKTEGAEGSSPPSSPIMSTKNLSPVGNEGGMISAGDLKRTITNEIRQTLTEIAPGIVGAEIQKASKESCKEVKQLITETMLGDFPTFDPSISHAQSKKIAKKANNANTGGEESAPSIVNAMGQVVEQVLDQRKKDDQHQDAIRCNVVLFGVPEIKDPDYQKRKQNDATKVDALLDFLETEDKPSNTFRIGTWKEFQEDGTTPANPRPLKATFANAAAVERLMNKCRKLKDATGEMTGYNVCHDSTRDQRENRKNMVAAAKEKTSNSPKYEFKVRGPPWNLREERYPKKAQ